MKALLLSLALGLTGFSSLTVHAAGGEGMPKYMVRQLVNAASDGEHFDALVVDVETGRPFTAKNLTKEDLVPVGGGYVAIRPGINFWDI